MKLKEYKMRDMSYFTNIDPINYNEVDNMKHLQYRDYKHLRDVEFETPIYEPLWLKIMATMGLICCFIVILFIA